MSYDHHEEIGQMMEEEGGKLYLMRSIVVDSAINWGDIQHGLRRLEFYFEGVRFDLVDADIQMFDQTSRSATFLRADNVIDTTNLLTGHWNTRAWVAAFGNTTNQRLMIVLKTPIVFDRLDINNSHLNGGLVDSGMKDVKLHITEDVLVWAPFGSAVPGGSLIYDGEFRMHVALDQADPETLVLI